MAQLTELIGRVPLRDLVRETTDVIEKLSIEAALELTGDNRASAAEMLGLAGRACTSNYVGTAWPNMPRMRRAMMNSAVAERPSPLVVLELLKPITWFPPMWALGCGIVSSGVSPDSAGR